MTENVASAPADGLPIDQLICGDCVQVLGQLPPAWAHLVFADPPFNIGYEYHDYDDRRDADEYIAWSQTWMQAVHRALMPTGSFWLAIGDEYAADLVVLARRKIGFHLRNWIVWHYTFGQQTQKKFARSHTHILYFTKDPKNFVFNADAIRVPSARQTVYADRRANPRGKVPDDVWYLRPQETDGKLFDPACDTWHVSRICGTFHERAGWHGCQMPLAILQRIIATSSNPGDVVLDPFVGSGTTAIAAAMLGRHYVGIDLAEKYVAFARKRLDHALRAAKPARGQPLLMDLSAVADPDRSSKVLTRTDAFGRPRVPRGRNARAAQS